MGQPDRAKDSEDWVARSLCTSLFLILFCVTGVTREFESLAPLRTGDEAVAAGRALGIGSALLEGPQAVEVMSYQELTVVYTAGKAGVLPGGGIRVAMRHVPQWTEPQTGNPTAPAYLTAKTSNGAAVEIFIDYRGKRFFEQYHPWQNIVEVKVSEPGLQPNDTIRVTYGDRSGGSPGIRVQPFDESPFVFKTYVDALGEGQYLPLADNPKVEVIATEPARLQLVMPSNAVQGQPTWCIVRAEDEYGNPAASYRGVIELQSTDPSAQLPETYQFRELDRGVHRFEEVTFGSSGIQRLQVADGRFSATGNPVLVKDEKSHKVLLWGDLHGHTLNSDGRGTVEQFYDFAERVAGLDFCAVTDHAFEILDDMWAHSKVVTNRAYKPGKFVTFQAYEWSGKTDVGGDHNIYFLEDDPPLFRSRSYYNYLNFQMYHGPEPQINHIEDMFVTLRILMKDEDILCIPHYGGRQGNPNWHNPKVQRMIEVFSEHRRSEDWVTDFLKKGYRLGIMASTDGHYGNPGYGYLKPKLDPWDSQQEIGMACVAVYAQQRTRDSIFRSLYDRQVYATSGDRIILDVQADGHAMGSEYKTRKAPKITVEVAGTAPISLIEVKKNSEVVYTQQPGKEQVHFEWKDSDFDPGAANYYYVRVMQTNNEEAISSPIWVN